MTYAHFTRSLRIPAAVTVAAWIAHKLVHLYTARAWQDRAGTAKESAKNIALTPSASILLKPIHAVHRPKTRDCVGSQRPRPNLEKLAISPPEVGHGMVCISKTPGIGILTWLSTIPKELMTTPSTGTSVLTMALEKS